MSQYTGTILFPPRTVASLAAGTATDGFTIAVQGYGSITGLAYMVPAHSDADFDIDLRRGSESDDTARPAG
jgi:hypothetical protein